MKQKISMGSPEDRGFEQKTFNFTLRDIFHPYFLLFLKPMKYFAKMLRYGFTVQISGSDGLPRLLTKRRLSEARYQRKYLNENVSVFHSAIL